MGGARRTEALRARAERGSTSGERKALAHARFGARVTDQIEALGHALARLGYAVHDDGARLIVDAPEGSTASVHPTSLDYLCTFTLLADIRASVAWANWTSDLSRDVARAWVGVAELPVREPVAVTEQPALETPPVLPREPVFAHAYAIGPLVAHAFSVSQDEAQRGRFRVVTDWHRARSVPHGALHGWDGGLPEYVDGPTLHWHAWGESTAFVTGVARAWAGLRGSEVKSGDPAARPVETILLRAAEGERLPSGIVALDFRGLPARTVHAVIEAIVCRVRSSEGYRAGVICLCDDHAAALVSRTVDLDCSLDC